MKPCIPIVVAAALLVAAHEPEQETKYSPHPPDRSFATEGGGIPSKGTLLWDTGAVPTTPGNLRTVRSFSTSCCQTVRNRRIFETDSRAALDSTRFQRQCKAQEVTRLL
jgi:hypothetical protein